MAKQQGSRDSNWEGMLKRWSVDQRIHHLPPSSGNPYDHPALSGGPHHHPAPKWRGAAQKFFSTHEQPKYYDIADRVYDIAASFTIPEDVVDESECECMEDEEDDADEVKMKKEDLLDELQAYVESIDVASVLHSDDCLYPLLHHVLKNKHAGIRAKGAEVVTTMVQNNPTSQQLLIKVNGLQLLLHNLTSDPDATSRTKALGAISALIRNNKSGITAFRLENGYGALKNALISESVWFQREGLNLIHYLLHENSLDCNIVTELRLPCIMMHLACSDDAEVRKAALRGLLVLARDQEDGNSGQLVKIEDQLKQLLQLVIEGISAMDPEDLGAAREERQLVDSLWRTCYNEPSSLGEKGLLVLPGEDACAPGVTNKLNETPLRVCAAAVAADRNSVSENEEDTVLRGLGPATTPTVQSNSRSKRMKLQ